MASTSASSVSVLMEKPKAYISANAPISETGMVTSGIRVARTERRNRKMMSTTRRIASPMVRYTFLIDSAMNTDLSWATRTCMPSGSDRGDFAAAPR